MAKRFDVPIGTVRSVVGELVAEHILVHQPGRGTFVGKVVTALVGLLHRIAGLGEALQGLRFRAAAMRRIPAPSTSARIRTICSIVSFVGLAT